MTESLLIVAISWAAISIASIRGEFCEIEKKIREIEAKTARMEADPRPKYVSIAE